MVQITTNSQYLIRNNHTFWSFVIDHIEITTTYVRIGVHFRIRYFPSPDLFVVFEVSSACLAKSRLPVQRDSTYLWACELIDERIYPGNFTRVDARHKFTILEHFVELLDILAVGLRIIWTPVALFWIFIKRLNPNFVKILRSKLFQQLLDVLRSIYTSAGRKNNLDPNTCVLCIAEIL